MSSLLDVLHKRPPRSRTAAPEPAIGTESPAPGAAADQHTVELRLATEADSALRTLTMRHPALPPADGLASDDETLRQHGPGPAADTVQTRRWSDPAGGEVASRRPAAKPRARWRVPALLALLVMVTAALGYAAFRFSASPAESFLAAPGDMPGVPAGAAATPAAAPVPDTAPPRKAQRIVAAAGDSAAVATPDEPAWYDQPALPAEATAAPAAQPVIQVTHGTTQDPLFDKLSAAYTALLAGDAARAESLYREVLAADAGSVDALLGLATLSARGGRMEEARDLFRQVQRLDPKNATAAAALSAMAGGGAATATESGLKGMLREQPDAAPLQFALGLRYVADQRWPDAQAAFFEAIRHDPTNADYAFNLAVALDRLGQVQAAASYYQRAIDLASGSQQFAVETARERLATLRGRQG